LSLALTPTILPIDEDSSMEIVTYSETSPRAPARQSSAPKLSVEAAWAAWQADGVGSSGSDFLQRVSPWMEGTAAQLLRQTWPVGAKRPTSSEVQDRLRHNVGLAARGPASTYIEALRWARLQVIEELRPARTSPRSVTRAPRS
jgi:hypothetical protein